MIENKKERSSQRVIVIPALIVKPSFASHGMFKKLSNQSLSSAAIKEKYY